MKQIETPYLETDCKISHEGREYEAGGAVLTEGFAIAYPGKFGGPWPNDIEGGNERVGAFAELFSWHGVRLGSCRIKARWPVPNSVWGSHMLQIEALINGVYYTGRGFGEGMIWKGKRKAKQEWSF